MKAGRSTAAAATLVSALSLWAPARAGANPQTGAVGSFPYNGATNSYELAVCASAGATNCFLAYASSNAAEEDTANRYAANRRQDGQRGNAFLHSSWNARMSVVLGSRGLADSFATAHERPIGSGNPPGANQADRHERMDLCNNHRGRDRPSNAEIVFLDQMTAVNKLYNDGKSSMKGGNTCNGSKLVFVRWDTGDWVK